MKDLLIKLVLLIIAIAFTLFALPAVCGFIASIGLGRCVSTCCGIGIVYLFLSSFVPKKGK